MKKLSVFFVLIAGLSNAQPQLSIPYYGSLVDSSSATFPYFIVYDIEIDNIDTAISFTDTLYLEMGIEDPPGFVTPMSITSAGYQIILPLDSVLIDTSYFIVDTSLLKEGNNTVVIWPYANSPSTASTIDSLFINVFIMSVGEMSENNIPISLGPNPASDLLFIHDSQNLITGIKIRALNGAILKTSPPNSMLNLKFLDEGVYLIELETKKGIVTRKLIVAK